MGDLIIKMDNFYNQMNALICTHKVSVSNDLQTNVVAMVTVAMVRRDAQTDTYAVRSATVYSRSCLWQMKPVKFTRKKHFYSMLLILHINSTK